MYFLIGCLLLGASFFTYLYQQRSNNFGFINVVSVMYVSHVAIQCGASIYFFFFARLP